MTLYLNRLFFALAVLAAMTLLASRWFPMLAVIALPLCWPSLFILAVDESTEKYGVLGEFILVWLCSLPWLWLCSVAVARWSRHRAKHPSLIGND